MDERQCKLLWLTVLRRAQEESEGRHIYVDREKSEHVRYLAGRWLKTWSRSYLTVCELAGLTEKEARWLQEQRSV